MKNATIMPACSRNRGGINATRYRYPVLESVTECVPTTEGRIMNTRLSVLMDSWRKGFPETKGRVFENSLPVRAPERAPGTISQNTAILRRGFQDSVSPESRRRSRETNSRKQASRLWEKACSKKVFLGRGQNVKMC